MNHRATHIALGLAVSLATHAAWAADPAEPAPPDMTTISMAGQQVPVVKGGLYDRFRSNPPLSVIAAEAPDVDLSRT